MKNNKTLYIHAGVSRTGCYYIQNELQNLNNILSDSSVQYFSFGNELVNALKSKSNNDINNCLSQISSTDFAKYIISSEHFSSLGNDELSMLVKFADFFKIDIKIVANLRRQDDLINSWYCEVLNQDNSISVQSIIDQLYDSDVILNYEYLLSMWENCFGTDNLLIDVYNENDQILEKLLLKICPEVNELLLLRDSNLTLYVDKITDVLSIKEKQIKTKKSNDVEQLILIKHFYNKVDNELLDIIKNPIYSHRVSTYNSVLHPDLRKKILSDFKEVNTNVAKKFFDRELLFDEYTGTDADNWKNLNIFENGYFDNFCKNIEKENKVLVDSLKKIEINKNKPNELLFGYEVDDMNYSYLVTDCKQKEIDKKIALMISIFYPNLTTKIIEYINRIPFNCDIYLSCNDESDYAKCKKDINNFHTIYEVDYPTGGMDLHPFFRQLKFLIDSGKKYDYYLKAHSKKDLEWAKSMYETNLPYTDYDKIFKILDENDVCGSGNYLYNFKCSHSNKSLILENIKKHKIKINEDDFYDKLRDFDPNKENVDPTFYGTYHEDLHTLLLSQKNTNKLNTKFLEKHWNEYGKNENGRVPNKDLIVSEATRNYKFFAGTFFWFSQNYLDYLLKNIDSFEHIFQKLELESGEIKNQQTTYTHHLEYWFGFLASHNNHPSVLKGVKVVTFLIPPLVEDVARSGGFRTLLRMINYVHQNGFLVNLEVCGDYDTTVDIQKRRIDLYNEIQDLENITLYFQDNTTFADVYIATGWQTYKKLNFYKTKSRRLTAFFCQDLEYEFEIVKANTEREAYTRNFYEQKNPTFTMSKFLATKFTDGRKIKSTSLNVDVDIFNSKNINSKNGICLLYAPVKKHRLPELVVELTKNLAEKYPTKDIYLYGDDTMKDLDVKSDNIKLLGTLTAEETAELYKKCELGVIFSTTNPSRIAYEMVACGTPVIEADCEYTKYDMDSDAFVRLKTDFDVIMNKLEELFGDSNEMDRLRDECEIYSKNNFKKNAEEQRFLEFVENDVMEKN